MRVLCLLCVLSACEGDGSPPSGDDDLPIDTAADPSTDPTPTPPITTDLTLGGAETCLRVGGGLDRVRSIAGGMPQGAAGRTLQAWVRTVNHEPQVALSIGLSAPGKGFFLATDDGYLAVSDGGLFQVDPSAYVADGAWHHVAVTFDGAQADLFLDGVHGLRVPMPDVDTADGEIVAGGTPSGGGLGFVGWIDDARIFDRVRSLGDMADTLDGDDRSLVLWWDFEVDGSGAGIEVPDLSATGAGGVTGGAEGTPEFLPCR